MKHLAAVMSAAMLFASPTALLAQSGPNETLTLDTCGAITDAMKYKKAGKGQKQRTPQSFRVNCKGKDLDSVLMIKGVDLTFVPIPTKRVFAIKSNVAWERHSAAGRHPYSVTLNLLGPKDVNLGRATLLEKLVVSCNITHGNAPDQNDLAMGNWSPLQKLTITVKGANRAGDAPTC